MKRVLAVLAAAMLLLAACGREGAEDESTLTSESAVPTASAGGGAEATDVPDAAATASAAAGGGATGGGATTAPTSAARTAAPATSDRKPPAEGRANPPTDGTYVYSYSGTASDPFNPSGPPEKFNGELTTQSSHSGSTYTAEITNSEQPGRTTIRTRWSSTKVEMLSLKTESAAGDFGCTFDPPLLIIKFPIKPETFPTQTLKGEGNACNGSLDITIVKKTTQKDATGKSWSVWEVKVKTTLKSGQLTLTQQETRWLSPELGVEIRSNGTSDGKYAAQSFKTTSTSALKKHP
jgi:hypothetical protein